MGRVFEVTFYREIVGDNGHCRNLPIEAIEIAQALSEEAAVAQAIRRFETNRGLRCWKALASHYAVHERRTSCDTVEPELVRPEKSVRHAAPASKEYRPKA